MKITQIEWDEDNVDYKTTISAHVTKSILITLSGGQRILLTDRVAASERYPHEDPNVYLHFEDDTPKRDETPVGLDLTGPAPNPAFKTPFVGLKIEYKEDGQRGTLSLP